jgi:hypothetical protein
LSGVSYGRLSRLAALKRDFGDEAFKELINSKPRDTSPVVDVIEYPSSVRFLLRSGLIVDEGTSQQVTHALGMLGMSYNKAYMSELGYHHSRRYKKELKHILQCRNRTAKSSHMLHKAYEQWQASRRSQAQPVG